MWGEFWMVCGLGSGCCLVCFLSCRGCYCCGVFFGDCVLGFWFWFGMEWLVFGIESILEFRLFLGILLWIFRVYFIRSKMVEFNIYVNVKEKIYVVRLVVFNKSNNEIVLVL